MQIWIFSTKPQLRQQQTLNSCFPAGTISYSANGMV